MPRKPIRIIIVIIVLNILLATVGGIVANIFVNVLPPVVAPYLKFQFIDPLLGIITLVLIVLQQSAERLSDHPETSSAGR